MNEPVAGRSNSEKRRVLFRNVEEFERLPRNWDSYGGVPMDKKVAAKVLELGLALIPRETSFFVVPLSEGDAQIEWHRDGLDVEIYVEKHR